MLVCLVKCGMWEKTEFGGGEKKLILIGCGKSAGECHCVDRNESGPELCSVTDSLCRSFESSLSTRDV